MTAPARPVPRSRRRRRWGGLVVLVTLATGTAMVLSTGFGRDPTVVRSALIGQPAPPLAGQTLDREELDLRDYRGQVVLVNFWASWCEACKEEHPVLTASQRRLSDLGLQVIGVDMNDTRADAKCFIKEMGGANYPSVFDPRAKIAAAWGVFGIPETYVVDRDGTIVAKKVGVLTPQWISDTVVPVLRS